jgi:hypothetical protein
MSSTMKNKEERTIEKKVDSREVSEDKKEDRNLLPESINGRGAETL